MIAAYMMMPSPITKIVKPTCDAHGRIITRRTRDNHTQRLKGGERAGSDARRAIRVPRDATSTSHSLTHTRLSRSLKTGPAFASSMIDRRHERGSRPMIDRLTYICMFVYVCATDLEVRLRRDIVADARRDHDGPEDRLQVLHGEPFALDPLPHPPRRVSRLVVANNPERGASSRPAATHAITESRASPPTASSG